jgi:hypothetical protein
MTDDFTNPKSLCVAPIAADIKLLGEETKAAPWTRPLGESFPIGFPTGPSPKI